MEGSIVSQFSTDLIRVLAISSPSRQMLTFGLYAGKVIDDLEKIEILEHQSSLKSANALLSCIISRIDGEHNEEIWRQLDHVESLKSINKKIKEEIKRQAAVKAQCNETVDSPKLQTPRDYGSIPRTQEGQVTRDHLSLLFDKLWIVQPVWDEFASHLPVDESIIKMIKANNVSSTNSTSSHHKLSEILDKWRLMGGTRTWRVIHTALIKSRRKDIADRVCERYPDLDCNVPFDKDDFVSIMIEVLKDVVPVWSTFAQHLGIPHTEIQSIKGEDVVTNCFNDLVDQWISSKGRDANIIDVIKACDGIGYKELANQLIKDTEMIAQFPVLKELN